MNIASDCILPGKAKHSSLEFVAAIVTVCVVIVTLLLVGSLIFVGHDHDDEHDYGYVEELHEIAMDERRWSLYVQVLLIKRK